MKFVRIWGPITAGLMIAGATAVVVAACSSDNNNSTGGATGDASPGTDASGTETPADGGDAGASVQRGEYLVKHVAACGDCHTPKKADGSPDETKFLAGNPGAFKVPGLGPDGGVGVVGPPNLTPDMATGLGGWTDQQIKQAFKNGVDKDGVALFPIMPYYVFHNISSEDSDAIVAYLRSIPAVTNEVPDKNFTIPGPAQVVPVASIPDPKLAPTDPDYASAMRGKYLAGNVGICMECHTKHVQGAGVPLDTTKLFAGGDDYPAAAFGLSSPPFPTTIYSENLTQDESGILGWSANDVVKVLKQGKTKEGLSICPPMPVGPNGAFGGLTDADALDIANYVVHLGGIANTISPICHNVVAADAGH